MSSIMRARNGLTGRSEVSEVIGLSPELKVAGPSMLGIGCPDRHALPRVNLVEICRARHELPSRARGFVLRRIFTVPAGSGEGALTAPTAAAQPGRQERVLLPHPCRSQNPSGPAQLGGQ